jgi:hypothetical protein
LYWVNQLPKKTVLVDGKKKCSLCGEYKELDQYLKSVCSSTGAQGACIPCDNKRNKIKYNTDPAVKLKQDTANKKSRLKKYGLTLDDFDTMMLDQNYGCKICGREFNQRNVFKSARVDHCHSTGKVRGLLCVNCNLGLGNFYDNTELLMNAIDYLKGNL